MKRKANALSLCLAAALLLGLSQCKKQETPITPPTPEETEEGIHITLDVEDGSRHVVIPGETIADVYYSFGDKIYVGDGSKYIGTLTNTGSTGGTSSHFEGTILTPSDGTSKLHFYFIGGLSPLDAEDHSLEELSIGETSFRVDISDQSKNLPVLSYGNAPYAKDATSYTCMLENKCALVKFGLNHKTSSAISVAGMVTKATINFKNPIAHSDPDNPESPLVDRSIEAGSTTGSITLYSESGITKWAILLPKDNDVEGDSYTVTIGNDDYHKTYDVTVPTLGTNAYIHSDITIDNHPEFSVSTSTKVMFSKGNLQYQASSSTWRFADNQWDYVGTHPEGQTGQGTIDGSDNAKILDEGYTGWMDLFGWGTWGSNGNPLNISTDLEDYTWSEFTNTLDNHNNWRTLSLNEWDYLLKERAVNNVPIARYAKAMVNNVAGLIVFSDNYSQPLEVTPPTNINVYSAPYTGNNYSADEWNILTDYGAVFLPAAGNRTVTTETTTEGEPPTTITTTTINVNDAGSKGYYWTSTISYHKYIGFDITHVVDNTAANLQFGCAVRLVRDIE